MTMVRALVPFYKHGWPWSDDGQWWSDCHHVTRQPFLAIVNHGLTMVRLMVSSWSIHGHLACGWWSLTMVNMSDLTIIDQMVWVLQQSPSERHFMCEWPWCANSYLSESVLTLCPYLIFWNGDIWIKKYLLNRESMWSLNRRVFLLY